MRSTTWLLGAAALIAVAVAADAHPRHRGFFGGFDRGPFGGGDRVEQDAGEAAPRTSRHLERKRMRRGFGLARVADADEDGGVTAAEWTAFLDSLNADESGVIDLDALIEQLPERPDGGEIDVAKLTTHLDVDEDGVVEIEDLDALFQALDANGDGELMSFETRKRRRFRGRARRKGGLVVLAADADASGDVTAEEWDAYLDSLGADEEGVISAETLLATLPIPEDRELPENAAERLGRILDRDRDGVLEIEDLEEIFQQFDKDADGAVTDTELPRLGT